MSSGGSLDEPHGFDFTSSSSCDPLQSLSYPNLEVADGLKASNGFSSHLNFPVTYGTQPFNQADWHSQQLQQQQHDYHPMERYLQVNPVEGPVRVQTQGLAATPSSPVYNNSPQLFTPPDTYDDSAVRHDSISHQFRRPSRVSVPSSILSPESMRSPNDDDDGAGRRTSHAEPQGRNREKNRMAASRCREKSKKLVDDLKKRERDLTAEKKVLKDCVAGLKDEVLSLKHEILRHGNCNCKYIENYLNTAAAKQMA
ncbi:hypothetical protein JX265_010316 [Neoarthrinium moseri]|uniref:BZIP domain-containing protein n=1 Tax=Neoarthrinium moseri TaxID=1658444 RepID=A0A9P9WEW3_9PEZI|nr:hypothetical protein JX265_010316 [Neoarthrinium moseri]